MSRSARVTVLSIVAVLAACGEAYPGGGGPRGDDGGSGGSGGPGRPGGGGDGGVGPGGGGDGGGGSGGSAGSGGSGGGGGPAPALACSLDPTKTCQPVDFGGVGLGHSRYATVRFCNVGGAPTGQLEFDWPEAFSPAALPASLDARTCGDVQLTFAPTSAGPHDGAFAIRDGPRRLDVALRAEAGLSAFRCTPEAVDFGWLQLGTTAFEELVCRNESPYAGSLKFGPVLGTAGDLFRHGKNEAIYHSVTGEGEIRFSVTYRADRVGPAFAEFDVFSRGLEGDEPVVRIALRGSATEDELVCPRQLDFGAVPVGESRTRALVCTSFSNDRWLLWTDGLGDADPDFRLAPHSENLPPRDRLDFEVTFAPLGAGPRTGTVWIRTDHPDHPAFEVRLRGEGVP